MSKVIAIFDKPKNCEQCPCFSIGHFYDVCRLAQQTKSFKEKEIPDWCPLREVPQNKQIEHVEEDYDGGYSHGFTQGYNACIDDILKGAEENG